MEVTKVTLERDSINMVQGLDQVPLRLIQLCMDWIISLQGIVKSTYVICTFECNLRLPIEWDTHISRRCVALARGCNAVAMRTAVSPDRRASIVSCFLRFHGCNNCKCLAASSVARHTCNTCLIVTFRILSAGMVTPYTKGRGWPRCGQNGAVEALRKVCLGLQSWTLLTILDRPLRTQVLCDVYKEEHWTFMWGPFIWHVFHYWHGSWASARQEQCLEKAGISSADRGCSEVIISLPRNQNSSVAGRAWNCGKMAPYSASAISDRRRHRFFREVSSPEEIILTLERTFRELGRSFRHWKLEGRDVTAQSSTTYLNYGIWRFQRDGLWTSRRDSSSTYQCDIDRTATESLKL